MSTIPAEATEPVSYTGRDPGNTDTEFLVTVWPDGSAQIAYRDPESRSWGPPFDLDRA